MPKYFSGRVKRTPQSGLTSDRYQYLGLDQAEPNLGDPPEVDNIPPGQQYQIVSIPTHPGERFWKQVGGGVVPGAITVREEGSILPNTSGISSITDLNIKGNILTAVGTLDSDGNPGTGVTITAAPVGNDHEVLFNNNGEFGAASGLSYDNTNSRVGIASTQPQETLDIDGTLFITGNVFDKDHDSGDENQVLVRSATGGLVWADQSGATAVAAGKTTQVQFHNDDGNLGGAAKLVYDYTNERIGIGSTQPTKLLDVLGDSKFKGTTDFDGNVNIDGVLTYEDVTNVDSIGIVTAGKGVRITSEGLIVVGVTTLDTTRFPDNTSLYFGADDDLQILHDGNDSIINDVATGSLKLQQGGNTRLEVTGMGVTVSGVTTTNVLSVTGFVTSHLIPSPSANFNLGSETDRWDYVYTNNIDTGSWSPTVVDTEQLWVSGLSTFLGLTRHQDGIVVTSGVSTFVGFTTFNNDIFVAGVSTSVGVSTFHSEVGIGGSIVVAGLSTFIGVTTSKSTLFAKQFSSGISSIGIGSANSLYVSGLSTFHEVATYEDGINVTSGVSTFVGFSTFTTGVHVTGFSTFVGISSFEGNVSFNAGIKDKDGDLGGIVNGVAVDGWLLESRNSKINWVNPQGLSVQNANKIGVGSVYGGPPLTDAGIKTHFVTFVPDNNPIDNRDYEDLYTTGLFVYDPIGQRVGIGTTIPSDTLSVTGITSFNGEVYFNSGVTGITSIGWNPSSSALEFRDDVKAVFGNDDDLQIYYDHVTTGQPSGGHSIIKSGEKSISIISGNTVEIEDENRNSLAEFHADGNVELYWNGTPDTGESVGKKLETSGIGITVTGLTSTTSLMVKGAFYDSNNSYGANSGYILQTNQASGVSWVDPGSLAFENANKIGIGSINSADTGIGTHFITFVDTNNPHDGRDYELLYSTGLFVYDPQDGGRVGIGTTIPSDTLSVTGISSFNGEVYFNSGVTGIASIGWNPSSSALEFRDDVKAVFGTDSDLEIYHEASSDQSTIYAPSKAISINSGVRVEIEDDSGNNIAAFYKDGSSELYYRGSAGAGKKLETSGIGITVTGLTSTTSLMVTGQLYDKDGEAGDANQILSSTGTGIDWIDPDDLTAANAEKVGIGTTNNAGGTDVQEYYVPFVRDNNPHNSRQNEFLYSDSKLVYRYKASDDAGGVGINTDVVGQELNVFSRGFAGVRVKSSRTTAETMHTMTQIGGIQFADSDHTNYPNGKTMSSVVGTLRGDLILKAGHDTTDNGSLDRVTITPVGHVGIGTTNPIADNITTALDYNNKVLAVGIVTADKFYGDGSGLTGVTGSGISAVEVKQYSDDLSQNDPRTERACDALDAPITVATNSGTAVIGIGSTSNAYGNRYIGDTEPTGNLCDGDIWYDTSSAGSAGVNGSTGITRVALLKDQKNNQVDGGTFTSGAWRDRDLTVEEDPSGFVNFVPTPNGQTTAGTNGNTPGYWSLPAGQYKIEWYATGFIVNRHKTRLVYSTTESHISTAGLDSSASFVEGSNANNTTQDNDAISTISTGHTVIKLTETTWFKVMHFCSTSNPDEGFGRRQSSNTGSESITGTNIYAQVKIEDLATAVKDVVNTGITKIATVKDIKTWNDDGGQFTAQTWMHRDLNTLSDPKGIGLSISGNIVTVPAGTYSMKWRAPGYLCNRFTSRLAYSSTSSTIASGITYVDGTTGYSHILDGVCVEESFGDIASITFTDTTYLKIEQYSYDGCKNPTTGAYLSTGLGTKSWIQDDGNGNSVDSVYTTLQIEDLSTAVKNAGDDYVSGISRRAKVEDIGTQWTSTGGQFPAGSWNTRSLTNVTDPKGIGIILNSTNNYIEVPAGTYSFRWSAPAMNVDRHVARLTYSNNPEFSGSNTFDLYGDVAFSENDADNTPDFTSWVQTRSTGFAPSLTFSAKTYIRVQHYSDTGNNSAGDAMGVSSPTNNCLPIFTTIEIEDLATAVKEQAPVGSNVPVGGIIMYHGNKTDLDAMTNWVLCDNSAAAVSAGAPDLRDKFVIGADSWSTANAGRWETNITGNGTQSGGSKDAVVVQHNHDIGNWGMTFGGTSGATVFRSDASGTNTTIIQDEGVSGTNKNLPPYYALAYIMRIS